MVPKTDVFIYIYIYIYICTQQRLPGCFFSLMVPGPSSKWCGAAVEREASVSKSLKNMAARWKALALVAHHAPESIGHVMADSSGLHTVSGLLKPEPSTLNPK